MDKSFFKITILIFSISLFLIVGIILRINFLGIPPTQNTSNEITIESEKVLGRNTITNIEPTIQPIPKNLSDNEKQILQNLISDILKQSNQLESDQIPSSEILNNSY